MPAKRTTIVCEHCGNSFPCTPLQAAKGRRYCSRPCWGASRPSEPLADRLRVNLLVAGPDDCWEWQGSRDANGYGRIRVAGRGVLVHRLAWELANGSIPSGAVVRHRVCDNPPCCNPAHLAVGTQADNIADAMEKDRSPRAQGTRNSGCKTSPTTVREMRRRYAGGGVTAKQLAKDFGMSESQMLRIVRRESWAHLSDSAA